MQRIRENVSELIQMSKSKTGKESLIVLLGNILGAGLGFFSSVLITRTLGPAQFGLFSISIAVMMIASQFSDFGIGTSLVRFFSLFHQKDTEKANLILKVALKFEIIIAALIFLLGFVLSKIFAVHIFGKPELILPLRLAFSGAFGTTLVVFISAVLQAKQSFRQLALVNLIIPAGKAILIGILFLAYKLNFFSALITFATLPFMAFLIGSLIVPRGFLKTRGNERESFKELFRFSRWILVSIFCVMLFDRLNVLMLGYFKPLEEVGYYSAANTFAFIFPLITGTMTTILLPKIAGISQKEQLRKYAKKAVKVTLPILFPLGLLVVIAKPAILFIYGAQYLPSAVIFQILISSFSLAIIANPIGLVIYSLNKPEIAAYVNVLQLILVFLGNILVIPLYGAIGAAGVTFLVKLLGTVLIGMYVYLNIVKIPYRKPKRKISILGFYGYGNIGDEAILAAMLSSLRNEINNVKITVFSNAPLATAKIHRVRAVRQIPFKIIPFGVAFLKGRFFQVLKELWKTELLIIGGGGFLSDWQGRRVIFQWLWPAVLMKIFKKKVMLYAVGVGPISTGFGKFLTKFFLNRFVDAITARDSISKEWLQKAGVKKAVYVTADPAVLLEPAGQERINEIFKKEGIEDAQTMIAITPCPIFSNEKYWGKQKERFEKFKKLWIKIIDDIILKLDAVVVIIPMQFPSDREFALKLAEKVEHKHRVKVIEHEYTPQETAGIIGRMDMLIGMRLHSLILSADMGIPMVGIIYHHKAYSFLKKIDKVRFAVDIGDGSVWKNKEIKFAEIMKNIEHVWFNRKAFKKDIVIKVRELRKIELLNALIAKSLLEGDNYEKRNA